MVCIFFIGITNRSFSYASPDLWNQLPYSFRQTHPIHSPPGYDTIRYDTIEEFNVDSKAEYTA